MYRLFTSIILLCSYCVPTFLGHAGLHKLFGVDHHGSHRHTAALENEAEKSHDHQCHLHDHHADHSNEKTQEQEPANHKNHSDEDSCTLCQFIVKSQLKVVNISIDHTESLAAQTVITHEFAPGLVAFSLNVPRGPPTQL